MQVEMLDDRILIEPMANQDHSAGGIYTGMPTTTFTQDKDKDTQITHGKVLSVGPGKRHPKTGVRLPVGVEPGQYVCFSDTCHRSAGINDEDWIVIRGGDVALVSDEPFEHCEILY